MLSLNDSSFSYEGIHSDLTYVFATNVASVMFESDNFKQDTGFACVMSVITAAPATNNCGAHNNVYIAI